ncbi:MAG: class I SAM-dependent methyltransferase, partial [Armatimonadetes bacterium]|nr:class I SAM-dependent methyltransferase [Armatimonadota bacterium]
EIGAACNGASVKAKAAYQDSIAEVFRNAVASMPSGGRLIVVAGDRANLYGRIAELVDVDVEAVVKRQVNRRTGRRSTDFFESVFVWRKR